MQPLVSGKWLFSKLDASGIQVVDASIFPPNISRDAKKEFATQHIKGARFFDIDAIADQHTSLPHMLPPPNLFAHQMRSLGITHETHVVAYDSMGIFGAARAWWMLRAMGHNKVSVLDGGLPKWLEERRPVTDQPTPKPEFCTYIPDPRPQLVKARDTLTSQLVDGRSAGRFKGTDPEPWPGRRSGHVPGALNVPFADLLNPDQTLRAPEEIRERFALAKVDLTQPITCMCGSGISACVLALGLYVAGYPEAAVYDGSWAEWGLPDGGPVETA